jgi:phosphoribosylanthranilate isomerase
VVRVKICGITNLDDALAAAEAGADALGFIFVPGTPRYVTVEQAKDIVACLPPFVTRVGVFANQSLSSVLAIMNSVPLDLVQLHGDESPEYCAALGDRAIKSLRVKDGSSLAEMASYRACAYLLDTYMPDRLGGTGATFDWELAREAAQYGPVILAGGLGPDNVAQAIRVARPAAVDTSSGVEASPGRKDHQKMLAFVSAAKTALDNSDW